MKKIFSLAVICLLITSSCKKKGEVVVVYPNPATNYIIFDATANSAKHKNGTITVKDFAGNVVQSFKMDDSSYIRWSIDSLQRGVYNYWYEADNMKTQTGKIQFN